MGNYPPLPMPLQSASEKQPSGGSKLLILTEAEEGTWICSFLAMQPIRQNKKKLTNNGPDGHQQLY